MKTATRFIYFDLGGVVIDNEEAKRGLSRRFQLDPDNIQRFFDEHWRDACAGTLSNKAYLAHFKRHFQITHQKEDFVDFITDYQGHYQETHDLICELVQHFQLGILSNAELGIIDVLRQKGKIPDIAWEVVIESAEHGVVKPDKRIYEIAYERAGVQSNEILFIDDREENVRAARALGWEALVFDYYNVPNSVQRIRAVLAL